MSDQTQGLDFAQIRARLADKEGPAYWRSLDQLADTDEFREFLHKEFPRQAAPLENGSTIKVTLTFETAAPQTVDVDVRDDAP